MGTLKTTLEIPDLIYRQLKISAAQQGKTVKSLVNEALMEKLRGSGRATEEPAWKKAFGGLRHLRRESARINTTIQKEFSNIDPEDWK